jgi:hypothetical protein
MALPYAGDGGGVSLMIGGLDVSDSTLSLSKVCMVLSNISAAGNSAGGENCSWFQNMRHWHAWHLARCLFVLHIADDSSV